METEVLRIIARSSEMFAARKVKFAFAQTPEWMGDDGARARTGKNLTW